MLSPLVTWFLRPSFWRLNIAVWLGFSVLAFLLRYFAQQDFERCLKFTLILLPVEILLSGLLREIYRRTRIGVSFQIKTAAVVIVLSLLAACAEAGVAHGAKVLLGLANPGWTLFDEWLVRILFMWLIYMGWSLGYFWLQAGNVAYSATLRAEQAQADALQLELQLLRSQLDPHFLFNSLNGVATEIEPNPTSATQMVRELSDYLRYSLDHRNRAVAPLYVELDAMRAYLRIEQARFGEQLKITVEATDDARHRLVPSFLLQPLVENAVKHGRNTNAANWDVVIRATTHVDKLILEVSNNGQLTTPDPKRAGVGLETLHRRLKLMYAERARFILESKDGRIRALLDLEGDPHH